MNLLELSKAIAVSSPNHSILLYGPPKGGKTRLVGTAARIPEVKRIFWFDLENGSETLMHMGLTDEEMMKITIIKIRDTRETPIAVETMLKVVASRKAVSICEMHGKVDCADCSKARLPSIKWDLSSCTHNDLIIIDSGSQLGDSAVAATCLGQDAMFKPGWDEYSIVSKWLSDIMSVIQQATFTNFIMITHEIALTDDSKKDTFFPLVGSKPFCMKVGKYFGTVIYVDKKMNKHVAGSASTYRANVITGSRVNATIEKAVDLNMRAILIEGGVLKEGAAPEETTRFVESTGTVAMESVAAPTGLAARIAQKRQEAETKRAALAAKG